MLVLGVITLGLLASFLPWFTLGVILYVIPFSLKCRYKDAKRLKSLVVLIKDIKDTNKPITPETNLRLDLGFNHAELFYFTVLVNIYFDESIPEFNYLPTVGDWMRRLDGKDIIYTWAGPGTKRTKLNNNNTKSVE